MLMEYEGPMKDSDCQRGGREKREKMGCCMRANGWAALELGPESGRASGAVYQPVVSCKCFCFHRAGLRFKT